MPRILAYTGFGPLMKAAIWESVMVSVFDQVSSLFFKKKIKPKSDCSAASRQVGWKEMEMELL